jgi:hypothetical protein
VNDQLSPVNRPLTLPELAIVFGMTASALGRLARRNGIGPACRIGRTSVYGPREIRRFATVISGEV